MALTKPQLLKIPPFDAAKLAAEKGKLTIPFQYPGPSDTQIIGNRLIISKIDDLTKAYESQQDMTASQPPVYNETIGQLNLTHTIDLSKENPFVNGCVYQAAVAVIVPKKDPPPNEEESPFSDPELFYCFSTPVLSILNEELQNNGVIKNSSFALRFSYSQKEGIPPEECIVTLCDKENQPIVSIHQKADTPFSYNPNTETRETIFSVPITGLVNEQQYFIGIQVKTQYGMEVALPQNAGFSVQYLRPSRMFAILDLVNQPDEGNIRIASNIVSIEGHSIPDPPKYEGPENNPRNVILTPEQYPGIEDKESIGAFFDKGFSIGGDFILQMVCKDLKDYEIFCELSNERQKIALRYVKDPLKKSEPPNSPPTYHVNLEADDGLIRTTVCSNKITLNPALPYLFLWVKKQNHLFDIRIKNSDGEEGETL